MADDPVYDSPRGRHVWLVDEHGQRVGCGWLTVRPKAIPVVVLVYALELCAEHYHPPEDAPERRRRPRPAAPALAAAS